MYDYRDYESQNKVASDKEKILKYLSEIENAFKLSSTTSKESAEIKKKEYDNRTLDDVKEQAVTLLSDYQNSSKKNLNDDYDNKKTTLNEKVVQNENSGVQRKENVSKYTENAKQAASDDALKRGLARSSIIVNKLAAFDQNQIDEFTAIDKEISDNISSLQTQISLLENQKQAALNDFDITYAVKLEEKISDLSKEIQTYNDKVLEYNNKIEQQEREYEDKQVKDNEQRNRDIYEFLDEYGGNNLTERLNSYKADYVMTYLNGLSKEEALDFLMTSEQLKQSLGSYYNSVLNKVKERSK